MGKDYAGMVRLLTDDVLKKLETEGDIPQLLECLKIFAGGTARAIEILGRAVNRQSDRSSSDVVQEAQDMSRAVPDAKMKSRLKSIISSAIKRNFDWNKNWMEGGIESGEAIQITKELEKGLGIEELYPTLLFEYTNLGELTEYFLKEHNGMG